jgi:hypothetical protein
MADVAAAAPVCRHASLAYDELARRVAAARERKYCNAYPHAHVLTLRLLEVCFKFGLTTQPCCQEYALKVYTNTLRMKAQNPSTMRVPHDFRTKVPYLLPLMPLQLRQGHGTGAASTAALAVLE